MKLRYLLDTHVVAEPALQNPSSKVLSRLKSNAHLSAISVTVWHELVYGVNRLLEGKRKDELSAYLTEVVQGSFPILPYDEEAAAWHGAERVRLEKLGQSVPFGDGQIAAIAFVNGLELVTDNLTNFCRFHGVTVKSWR